MFHHSIKETAGSGKCKAFFRDAFFIWQAASESNQIKEKELLAYQETYK